MTERSTLVAGETLIDFIPDSQGSLTDIERFERRAGGAPANVAVALARLAETPWFCTTLSTDPFGRFLERTLAEAGLPDRFYRRVDAPTALAFVSHDNAGDREFTFYHDGTADVQFDTAMVDDGTLNAVDYLVVGGVTLAAAPSRRATFDLVDRARKADCRVVFDTNTRPELWSDTATMSDTLDRMIARTDLLKTTREDLQPTDIGGDAFAEDLLERGTEAVLLTAGEAGARLVAGAASPWGAGEWHHSGYAVEDVVDTTGAGDAFLAGAITALIDEEGPTELLARANAVAALTTTTGGAMAALPDREALAQFRETAVTVEDSTV